MGSSSVPCLLTITIAFLSIDLGACTRCYFCTGVGSYTDDKNPKSELQIAHSCVDVADTNGLPQLECAGDCVKGVIMSRGVKVVMRGCKEPSQCQDKYSQCFHCEGHLCNSSTNVVPSFVAVCVIGLGLLNVIYG